MHEKGDAIHPVLSKGETRLYMARDGISSASGISSRQRRGRRGCSEAEGMESEFEDGSVEANSYWKEAIAS